LTFSLFSPRRERRRKGGVPAEGRLIKARRAGVPSLKGKKGRGKTSRTSAKKRCTHSGKGGFFEEKKKGSGFGETLLGGRRSFTSKTGEEERNGASALPEEEGKSGVY